MSRTDVPCGTLFQITELIHVASLLHDDVIDSASMRRGLKALNITFGNKVCSLPHTGS